jgi:hypothetical protein
MQSTSRIVVVVSIDKVPSARRLHGKVADPTHGEIYWSQAAELSSSS